MAKSQDNFKRGTTEILVLHLLTKEDLYGYRIIQLLSRRSKGKYILLEGTLYLILLKMEDEGYIEGYTEFVGEKRQRRYYHITEKGRARYEELLHDYDEIALAVNLILDRTPPNDLI